MDAESGPAPNTRLIGIPTSPGVGFGPVVHLTAGTEVPAVVVAADVGPAEVVSFATGSVAAVATAGGAPLSHASILARSLGVPAVTGLGPALLEVPAGTLVLVDGDAGVVEVAPGGAALDAARARQAADARRRDETRRRGAEPATTRDGLVVSVVANVGGVEDARLAVLEGADGIGMLRTEFAFLGRAAPPDEDEQYRAYRAVADAIGDRPLVVRTLDLGADVPAWDASPEPNPALGNRGLRLGLGRRDLFETQLRAIVRLAADRPLGLMFPMVTTVDELDEARARLGEVAGGRGHRRLDVGITVEVPAAALIAEAFAARCDFLAIGTNDLTQYTLACDRANADVAHIADGLHPAVLRLVRQVVTAADEAGRTVWPVGELGTDPAAIPILLGLGVVSLSVRPNAVAAVKEAVRAVAMDEARPLALAALAADSASAVRALASRAQVAS